MASGQFHRARRIAILRDRPDVKTLFGTAPGVAAVAVAVVIGHVAIAAVLADRPIWIAGLAAFAVGAFLVHYLNVVIHECSHNLVFASPALNRICAIAVNLPAIVPSAMAFRHYHLLHHRFLGRRALDADAPLPWEVALVGGGRLRKALWLLAQPLFYGVIHPMQVRERVPIDGWLVANVLAVVACAVAVGYGLGWSAFLYLALSTYFAIGPHPTGAHTIQEHFAIAGGDETASYYGPVNAVSLNHGLHLEHHDFPNVPGSRLGALRRMAPQYYAGRFHYRSRLLSLWTFVMDRAVTLDRRVLRGQDGTAVRG
ncbi:MAG TPA: fatty acid desaturase [Stellaceae bacterium]|nr:fatty acid desaturase [Stellaceae bacterium]